MDLQGTPLRSGGGTKVTDPKASQQPVEEPSGPVADDSLAAQSVRQGGGFSENRDAEPLGVSGSQSTLNTTDASAASTLPSAPVGSFREDRSRQEKYPEALGGQGNFPGKHVPETGYTGGSTAAKQQMGLHAGEYPASQKMGQAPASGSDRSEYNAGQAPSYVSSVTGGYQHRKPNGQNIQEDGFSSDPKNNASFTSEIGSEQDPGRAAENRFQRTTQESGLDAGNSRQKGLDTQHWYSPLDEQRA